MYKYTHHIFKQFCLNRHLSRAPPYKQYLFMTGTHRFTLNIGKETVPITTKLDVDVASVLEFQPFKEWASALSNEMKGANENGEELKIRNIEIQSVDYFGPKIGFIKFKVDAIFTETGKSVPGIVFMVIPTF